jgi:hypothetical protein
MSDKEHSVSEFYQPELFINLQQDLSLTFPRQLSVSKLLVYTHNCLWLYLK